MAGRKPLLLLLGLLVVGVLAVALGTAQALELKEAPMVAQLGAQREALSVVQLGAPEEGQLVVLLVELLVEQLAGLQVVLLAVAKAPRPSEVYRLPHPHLPHAQHCCR